MEIGAAMPDPSTDELIARWMRGDREAAALLYERYYSRAWRFGLAITRREADAEDAAQEALASGLEVLRDGRRPEKFTGWLLGAVKYIAWRRHGASRLPEGSILPDPATKPPSKILVAREMELCLKEAMEELTAAERDLVERRFLQGERREDLARDRSCSTDTLDRDLLRVLAKLRDLLSGHFTSVVLAPPGPTLEAVEGLRPSFRQALMLRHVQGLTLAQVAGRLGVPEDTIKERLDHAYRRLQCSPRSDFSALRGGRTGGRPV